MHLPTLLEFCLVIFVKRKSPEKFLNLLFVCCLFPGLESHFAEIPFYNFNQLIFFQCTMHLLNKHNKTIIFFVKMLHTKPKEKDKVR